MSTSTTTEPGAVLEHRLTAMDRCDSCGAQAYIAAEVMGVEALATGYDDRVRMQEETDDR